MTFTFPLSVKEKFAKKTQDRPSVIDIISQWKDQGSASFKICEAIVRYYIDQQKGQKIERFISNQSSLEVIPPSYDVWNKHDLTSLNIEDLQRLYKVMTMNRDTVSRLLQPHIAAR